MGGIPLTAATVEGRALQGLFAVALWFPGLLLYRILGSPVALRLLVPLPMLILVAHALSPWSWLGRLDSARWRRVGYLGAAALTGVAAGGTIAALASLQPTTDQPATMLCASQDLLHGRVPYLTFEPQCFRRLRDQSLAVTPIGTGPFAELKHPPSPALVREVFRADQRTDAHGGFPSFGYPPDAALLTLPAAFDGWMGLTLWVLGAGTLLFAVAWIRPVPGRRLLIAWQLTAFSILLISFKANPEDLSYLLLALAFAYVDWARSSALFMAGAICTNPLSWPVAPVYCAIVMREPEARRRFLWLAAAIALGIIPWWTWDHSLITQMATFVTMPVFPAGFALGIYLPEPSGFRLVCLAGYTVGIAIVAVIAWRYPEWRWSMAGVVWATFLLGWKGPAYYFLPALWLGPSLVVANLRTSTGRWPRNVSRRLRQA